MTKNFLAILFLGVSKRIETVAVIESFFLRPTQARKHETEKKMDLENKPNMKRTRIGGGYMVVGYGSGGGIW